MSAEEAHAVTGAYRLQPIYLDDLTPEEIQGLMAELLYTDSPPAGTTKLTDWARDHAETLGRRYASELARRKRPQ